MNRINPNCSGDTEEIHSNTYREIYAGKRKTERERKKGLNSTDTTEEEKNTGKWEVRVNEISKCLNQ